MKRFFRCTVLFVIVLTLCSVLTGCLSTSAEELYRLPKSSERNTKIQKKIDELLGSGLEYAAPVSGYNRQAIQQFDLDSDSIPEVIAFFRSPNGGNALIIAVIKETNGVYEVVARIEGEGEAVDSIAYSDLDGDGSTELLVGWQMSASVKSLSLYSMKDYEPVQLASSVYSTYICADLSENGGSNVLLFHEPTADAAGETVLYRLMADGEIETSSASLTKGIQSISRVQVGGTSDGHTAVYVDSNNEGGLVTDVFAVRDGAIQNIAGSSDNSPESSARSYNVYCTDVDNDGVIEIPVPRMVYAQSETTYYVLNWTTRTVRGYARNKLSTYHNYVDGWFITIPDNLAESITIRRGESGAGERAVILSVATEHDGNTSIRDILAIYKLTGENRVERAVMDGRFLILQDDSKLYSGCILPAGEELLNRQTVIESFSLIRSTWLTDMN